MKRKGSLFFRKLIEPFIKLNPCSLLLVPALLAAVFLASCAPSYPKGRLTESLVELCRSEYGLDVKAQISKSTLGVLVVIPGLIEELRRQAGGQGALPPPVVEVSGEFQGGAIDFSVLTRGSFTRVDKRKRDQSGAVKEEKETEPMEQLRHVSMALHRVTISTDSPVEFYTLIARDPGPESLDVLFIGHVGDSKKFQYMAISRGDLQFRSDVNVRIQPEFVARRTVSGFLTDMQQMNLPELLGRYIVSPDRVAPLFPKILAVAADLQGKQHRLPPEEEWSVRQIEEDTVLVYVPLYAIGHPGAVLFTIQIEGFRGGLFDIQQLETSVLPARYREFGSHQEWNETFYVKPLSLPDFVVHQIEKRMLAEFEPLDEDPEKASAQETATLEEVTRVLVETAAYVVHSYEFSNFQQMIVTHAPDGTRWIIPSSELPLYRRRHPPELKPVP